MWSVLVGALAARRGQAVVVTLVALLASAAVTAAPWYAVKATQQVGVAAVSSAPVEQRLVSVSWLAGWRGTDGVTSEAAMKQARKDFRPPGFTTIDGAFAQGGVRRVGSTGTAAVVKVAYRADVFDHLTVTGSRPSAAGEIVLPAAFASEVSLRVGDEVQLTGGKKPSRARLVGVYRVIDPSEPYWADGYLVGLGSDDRSKQATVFTVPATMSDWEQTTYSYDLLASPRAFATMDVEDLSANVNAASRRWGSRDTPRPEAASTACSTGSPRTDVPSWPVWGSVSSCCCCSRGSPWPWWSARPRSRSAATSAGGGCTEHRRGGDGFSFWDRVLLRCWREP